jgi:hypothetical protein
MNGLPTTFVIVIKIKTAVLTLTTLKIQTASVLKENAVKVILTPEI